MKIEHLMSFLEKAPTAYHAVDELVKWLTAESFELLQEGSPWQLRAGKKYCVARNGSLAAFIMPEEEIEEIKLVASHTDSPSLKLKPNAEQYTDHLVTIGLEVYGEPLLTSWLNRDLGLAGKITCSSEKKVSERLVNIKDAPMILAQLAVHLDREVNQKGLVLNRQEHLSAIASIYDKQQEPSSLANSYLEELLMSHIRFDQLIAHDLFLYPLEVPRRLGAKKELLASWRLDNLASVHASSWAIAQIRASKNTLQAVLFFDNEEIGSTTTQGADSTFANDLIERIFISASIQEEARFIIRTCSRALSVDMAHAYHPHYSNRYEPNHKLFMGQGVAIKYNANQRYSTDHAFEAYFQMLAKKHSLPLQKSVSRSDISCGTTVGPILAAALGIPTLDIGIPQLSMHSAREVMAVKDYEELELLLEAFLSGSPDEL
jgi:aspartyl aminopeptidase